MRFSLAPRRASCQRTDQKRRSHILAEPSGRRDQAASATETVALVLGEDSPLPETAADVQDLVLRLRGHVGQLGILTPSQEPALLRAQQLCSGGLPEGYMPSRVHLVRLAEATQELIAVVRAGDAVPVQPKRGRRWWELRLTVLRGSVFALGLGCSVLSALGPRT